MSRIWQKYRALWLSLSGIVLLMLGIELLWLQGYHLVYNPTPSMPIGFYWVMPVQRLRRSEIVEFVPPATVRPFLQAKRWLPARGSLLKYVSAVAGDRVCVQENKIFINGRALGLVYRSSTQGDKLPQWHFCGKLQPGEYLLLSTKHPRSFDGRYFGPVTRQEIRGKARPLFRQKNLNEVNHVNE